MKITAVELTDQECYDILTTAIESGYIEYWACQYQSIHIWRDKELNITKASIYADSQTELRKHYTITPATIRRGVLKALNLGVLQIDDATDPDFDAADADNIIQAALFGELVYG